MANQPSDRTRYRAPVNGIDEPIMEAREGRLNIVVHGADSFGLQMEPAELDDRNYRLTFEPFRTEKRLSDFDGVITFQRLYERFERKSNYMNSWLAHSCDRDEMDKREKEADLLLKQGGFIVFLLHLPFLDRVYENMHSAEYRDTDLVKRFLNWRDLYREDYDQRVTSLSCVRDEFTRFFELYGAVWSSFSYHGGLSWRNLALRSSKPVSMVIGDYLFFIPCLLPEERSDRKEEFFRLLSDAIVSCVKKLRVEVPPWVDQYLLPQEDALVEEQAQLSSRLEALEQERSQLSRFKRVLVSDGDSLVDDTVNLLTNGLGLRVTSDEQYREDIRILGEDGNAVALGEVKGTNKGVKREFVNQADSHRERAGLPPTFPVLLIVNTHIKNSRTVQEKDQEVPAEQIAHAVRMNVLITRTFDLLNLLALAQKGMIARDALLTMLKSERGWLRVVGDEVKAVHE